MKKTTPLFVVALLIFTVSQAQNNAIKLQIGYGIPLVNSSLATTTTSLPNFSATRSNVNGSYGSGLQLEAGYIRSLSGLVAIQFDATYLAGKKINSNQKYLTYTDTYSSYARFLQFSPQIRLTFGGRKLRPYASMGPVVGIGSIYKKSHYNNDGPIIDSEETFKGSAAIGLKTSLGAEMELGKFIFYAQLGMVDMNYAPSQSKITKYLTNGNDGVNTLTVSQRQTEYKNSYNSGAPGAQNSNQPAVKLKQYYPLNSFGLNAGVMYRF